MARRARMPRCFRRGPEREHGKVWLVHRLDRETSGVLLMALPPRPIGKASLWFQKHEVRKAYDLLARSPPRPDARIKAPSKACFGDPGRMQAKLFGACFLGARAAIDGQAPSDPDPSGAAKAIRCWGIPTYGGPRLLALAQGRRHLKSGGSPSAAAA